MKINNVFLKYSDLVNKSKSNSCSPICMLIIGKYRHNACSHYMKSFAFCRQIHAGKLANTDSLPHPTPVAVELPIAMSLLPIYVQVPRATLNISL